MAKKVTKKEEKEVIKEVGNTIDEITKTPEGKETKGDVTKVQSKMKKEPINLDEATISKVDLAKPIEAETEEVATAEVPAEETQVIEEVTEEEKVEEVSQKIEEAVKVAEASGEDLPEGITKLVNFMAETGGDLSDYVKLNKNYSDMDNQTVLEEYYKQTKPHLDQEEISFLLEDNFSFDEDIDEDRDIKRKKLALKEQVADARKHLDGLKSKYYEEIKGGSKLTNEQQEALNFYNEQKEVQAHSEGITSDFVNKTNRFFGDQFKGFEYNVGDKRFRYNVQDVAKVKENQTDIDNFIGKFLDKDGKMAKESEYHKSLYTAMNADAIANHFYEQGKADATKSSVANAKNVDMTPRQQLNDVKHGGIQVRALNDDSTPTFKFKIKNKN